MKIHIKKRLVVILAVVCVVTAFIPLAINAYVVYTGKKMLADDADLETDEPKDCALILGAGVYPDGRMSPMLEDRVKTGIQLYQNGTVKKLLFSGDHGKENYDEVGAMKHYAMEQGVPEEDIFMDHAGFCTYDSVYRARDVFDVSSMVIVTQQYHLYRALYTSRVLGVDAVGVDADLQSYSGQTMREAREILARNKDFFIGLFQPKPTYLGTMIPISGDGRLTEDD